MTQFCPELRADPLIVELQAAVRTIVQHQLHELHAPPPGFVDEVWPYYLDALENGEANQSYWLSYVELLAVATLANVKLVVFEERSDGFHFQGDTLDYVVNTYQEVPILVSVRGGGRAAVNSHFERLISHDTLTHMDTLKHIEEEALAALRRENNAMEKEDENAQQVRIYEHEQHTRENMAMRYANLKCTAWRVASQLEVKGCA